MERVLEHLRRHHSNLSSPEAVSFRLALHRLWSDHVIWTGSTW